uniref:Uncharacterized protein n=1 Tax=Anguilla anguilla TaxID=7936 RepID=A0A0E9U8H5_ANGAN
MRMFAGRWAV